MNLILVSSDYGFPSSLANPSLQFQLEDINDLIYAGEIPPNQMMDLLRNKWGIGECLSIALVNNYGGHIWRTYQSLLRLQRQKHYFTTFNGIHTENIEKCLEESKQYDYNRMKELLAAVAEKGFKVLLKIDEKAVEIISKNNIGGVIRVGSTYDGLSPEVFQHANDCNYVLVPSSHSMRIIIAAKLSKL